MKIDKISKNIGIIELYLFKYYLVFYKIIMLNIYIYYFFKYKSLKNYIIDCNNFCAAAVSAFFFELPLPSAISPFGKLTCIWNIG